MSSSDFLFNEEVAKTEVKEGIGLGEMEQLQSMIEVYEELEAVKAAAEKKFKEASARFNEMSMQIIPEFLLAHGISEMKLADGRKVTVKEDISVTIRDEFAFRKFLEERNETDIIKTNYKLGRMDARKLNLLTDYLIDNNYDFEVDESIHSQTKKKYVKELIKQIGRSELPEWMSIYDIRTTKIK